MNTTNIYFMQAGQGAPIKIGKANDTKSRLRSHQTSNWEKLILILEIKGCHPGLEMELKKHYRHFLIRGEWFKEDILNNKEELETIIIYFSSKHRKDLNRKNEWMIWSEPYKKQMHDYYKQQRRRRQLAQEIKTSIDQSDPELAKTLSKEFSDEQIIKMMLTSFRKNLEMPKPERSIKEAMKSAWGEPPQDVVD